MIRKRSSKAIISSLIIVFLFGLMITSISFAVNSGNNYYAEIGTMSLDATSNAYTDLEELEAITKMII